MMGEMNAVTLQALRRGLPCVVLAVALLAGCQAGSGKPRAAGPTPIGVQTATPVPGSSAPPASGPLASAPPASAPIPTTLAPTSVVTAGPIVTATTGATPSALPTTTDALAPPADGRFHATITAIPLAVLDRSTWSFGCPVTPDQLRYVTVSFKGFDGRAHTGELLVNRSAARGVVTVFRKLFAAGWPIQGMRIVTAADLSAPGAGDGNNTSAFTCRAVTGSKTAWSEHAYGLAIDLDPFQNPYLSGRTIIPALAGAYRARTPVRPGMNTAQSLPVRAFRAIGWRWGGNYVSKKDYMHFSANGG
jgi:hypothetical protein